MREFEYQPRKEKDFLIPQAVYKQAVWAVKDLPRLREKFSVLKGDAYSIGSHNLLVQAGLNGLLSDVTSNNAIELVNLSFRINAIEEAAEMLPEKYKMGVLTHITNDVLYDETFANIKTWRRWQQVFIYYCALNLKLL